MKLKINGAIVSNDEKWIYELLGMEATSPKDIIDLLPESNEDIEVLINSGGGNLNAGSEIYTALKDYGGGVSVKIVALAASAASLIAMAGDIVEMSPVSRLMIHNPAMIAQGDNRDFRKSAEILDKAGITSADAYALKSGKKREEILEMMNDETWFTPDEAIEHGFADSKMFEEEAPTLVASNETILSKEAINNITAILNKTPEVKIDVDEIANKVIEKLNITKEESKIDDDKESKINNRFFF
ncbi:head maturation protease, ClpP-related [Staphylococcus xylosus]|uniref:head maturation protease, ClpP-related n=1 Tax=Staphylococcus xylosus TaxID=1288 RepID=UPI001C3EE466|nr:head maturation protease, ClpP-related [Staphylococcus xylosus]